MTDHANTTRDDLLAQIETAWSMLIQSLDRLTAASLTNHSDAAGWTVKDHVVHLAGWENTVVAMLNGRPRYEGLGVIEAIYASADVDASNEAHVRANDALSMGEARAELERVHADLLELLRPMSDEDLARPVSDFISEGPDLTDDRPAIDVVFANTTEHYREHHEWMMALAGLG